MLQSVVSELNESCSPEFSYTNDNYLTMFMQILPKINYSNKHILSTTLLAVGKIRPSKIGHFLHAPLFED